MTGYSRNAIVHQGRLDRGTELISKPLIEGVVARKIRQVLDSRSNNQIVEAAVRNNVCQCRFCCCFCLNSGSSVKALGQNS